MYERVRKPLFYIITLCYFFIIVTVTIIIKNLVSYLEMFTNPWIIYTNTVFPNIILIAWRGYKQEKLALICSVIGSINTVLTFFFAIIDLAT